MLHIQRTLSSRNFHFPSHPIFKMIRFLLLLSLALSLVFANTKCTPHTRLKRQAWYTPHVLPPSHTF